MISSSRRVYMNLLPLFLALLCADVLAFEGGDDFGGDDFFGDDSDLGGGGVGGGGVGGGAGGDGFGWFESNNNACPGSMTKDKCREAAEKHWSAGGRRIFNDRYFDSDYRPRGCSYDKRVSKLVAEKTSATDCYDFGGCATTPTYTDEEKYAGVIWNDHNKGDTHKNLVRLCMVKMCGTLPLERLTTSQVKIFYQRERRKFYPCADGYIPMVSMENCYLAYKGYQANPPKQNGYPLKFTWGGWLRSKSFPIGCSVQLGGAFVWNVNPNAGQRPTHNGQRGIVCQGANLQTPHFGCVDNEFPYINQDTSITPKIANLNEQSQTPQAEATPNLLPVVVVLSVLCLFLMVVVGVCIYKRRKGLGHVNATAVL